MCRTSILFVDHHAHTSLAMLALRAVQPNGFRGGNVNGVNRGAGVAGLNWLEAREESGGVTRAGQRGARRIKGGLSDGVVGRVELELDLVSDSGNYVVGEIFKRSIRARDSDDVDS